MTTDTAAAPQHLECDLVMKGGITSGVIYPRLVAKLAERYRFRSIGGTSAGAIAAAATAAAQLGVYRKPQSNAFARLDALPRELGTLQNGESMLLRLFQPMPRLAGHFRVLTAALNAPSASARLGRVLLALLRAFPLGAVLGALPGLLLVATSWGFGQLLAVALVAAGAITGAAVQGARSLLAALPASGFGLCSGMQTGEATALTPWLEGYLRELAGATTDHPVTFGDLWHAPHPPGLLCKPDEHVIELTMMTTAVNVGRPYRVPFESNDLYFLESELAPYFPTNVMRWLVAHARTDSKVAAALRAETGRPFIALPRAEHLPVIVGVRLSLSFPLLLSAIPLYTVDRTLPENQGGRTRTAAKVWFSDGGLCSNFPVHFFDSPLPGRPTFAVNLRDRRGDEPLVQMPAPLRNNSGIAVRVEALGEDGGGAVLGFLGKLLHAARSWHDELQLTQPGFRDRIVHVHQQEGEGGLNLNMQPDVIDALAARGAQAAGMLIDGFHPAGASGGVAWQNHQRVRLRVTVEQLQGYLTRLDRALARPAPDYRAVAGNPPLVSSYTWENEEAEAAKRLLDDLRMAVADLERAGVDLARGAPRPSPELRSVPRV